MKTRKSENFPPKTIYNKRRVSEDLQWRLLLKGIAEKQIYEYAMFKSLLRFF
jgi:hypothetical protein